MVDLERFERILVQAARERRALTYGEILRYFERRVTPVTVGALCRDLAVVCRRVEARGGPDLACLVVRHDHGLPGEGYFAGLRAEEGYDGPSNGPVAEAVLRRRQAAAFAYFCDAVD